MTDDVFRLLIVFVSLITIPYLIILIKSTASEKTTNSNQKSTRLLLLALFTVMLAGSIMSLTISSLALFPNYIYVNGHFSFLSRARTLFLTIGNFFLALHFYHIHNTK